ncbi:MAG: AIR synthase-related protein, partial [Betaproteobacteria bacterium]|nr:AIR synthase-related protein [Betaproteobacteria bacterium]
APATADAHTGKELAGLLAAQLVAAPDCGWLILPRPGMVSPWSSKAGAIAASCGIAAADLFERASWHQQPEPPDCDRMLETVIAADQLPQWIAAGTAGASDRPSIANADPANLAQALQLQLDAEELARLDDLYRRLGRQPTATELLLIAQTNSEHCRHKTFRAPVAGMGEAMPLFDSIRSTHAAAGAGTLVAYADNAAIIEFGSPRTFAADDNGYWRRIDDGEPVHTVIKAETHNHPTGISPHPGAATGAGGEIRDEAAAGRGAASHAGFAGYMTSDLHILAAHQPWEKPRQNFPARQASAQQIIIDAPLGAAAFGNEFGRPTLAGFFRTLEHHNGSEHFGYHKPVMIAGGLGEIGQDAVSKLPLAAGDLIVQLGGPGLRIGISGGAASSNSANANADYASVQRANAQMQRRAQEAIDACRHSSANPLKSIHDVGAGGIGNAIAELADPHGCEIDLQKVPVGQNDLADEEIWCNEAQERYVAALDPADLTRLEQICTTASCPLAVVGKIASHGRLQVAGCDGNRAVDLPLADLFGADELPALAAQPPQSAPTKAAQLAGIEPAEATRRVLSSPAVADKSFLITIADRSVGGLTGRDQLVGPWQVAVADCATTFADHFSNRGRAMAIGERPAVAIIDPAASARLAVAEALTNLAAADLENWQHSKLSLNWMAACDSPAAAGELVAAVRAVCTSFLPQLGISV